MKPLPVPSWASWVRGLNISVLGEVAFFIRVMNHSLAPPLGLVFLGRPYQRLHSSQYHQDTQTPQHIKVAILLFFCVKPRCGT